jgi:hypothetical protein
VVVAAWHSVIAWSHWVVAARCRVLISSRITLIPGQCAPLWSTSTPHAREMALIWSKIGLISREMALISDEFALISREFALIWDQIGSILSARSAVRAV